MFIGVGKVVFDFYGNQELRDKKRLIEGLVESVTKQFNVAISEVGDFDDLERGTLGISVCAAQEQTAKTRLKKVMDHIDQTSPARIVAEESDVFQYSDER